MSETVRVGRRYTVVIPRKIRRQTGLKENDLLKIWVEKGRIILEPVEYNPFKILEKVIGEPYSEETDEKAAEEWLRHARGRH